MQSIKIADFTIGAGSERLTLIAGPCVAESLDMCREICQEAKTICVGLGINYVFKASYDKANRTSINSYRGPGIEIGLQWLKTIKDEFCVPVLTDIHETSHASLVAEVVDILQIPAFLCRQTDLLVAAARTGKVVNIKKGQFLAPWDMQNVAQKVADAGNTNIILTERGVSFGYNTLVVDMYALTQMRELGYPVCFDATHSVQQPGAGGTTSGGRREAIPTLTRAAMAAGVDALFMEIHPDPQKGLSDPATMFPLNELQDFLSTMSEIDRLVRPKLA